MTFFSDRRGHSRRAAPPLRASTWAATVTGDQPPPTRCPAPSPEQPQRTFLAGPLTPAEGPARKVRCPECAQRDLSVGVSRGPCLQTRDRRRGMRLARRLGPAAVAGPPATRAPAGRERRQESKIAAGPGLYALKIGRKVTCRRDDRSHHH